MALALGLATVTDARQDASLRGFEQFQLWIALVQKHELGQVDASVQTVADWDLIKLMDVLASLRTVGQLLEAAGKGQSRIEVNGRVLGVDMIAPLLGLTVAESRLFGDLRKLVNPDDPMRKAINRVLTKGAMLHSQVALTASDELKPAAPRSVRIQASAVQLRTAAKARLPTMASTGRLRARRSMRWGRHGPEQPSRASGTARRRRRSKARATTRR